jgi:hypothetical protein
MSFDKRDKLVVAAQAVIVVFKLVAFSFRLQLLLLLLLLLHIVAVVVKLQNGRSMNAPATGRMNKPIHPR